MIELMVIRHGIAEDRDAFNGKGVPIEDHERRLTDKGRSRMAEVAEGLQWAAPELDLIAASPLVRAVETAEIIARAYGGVDVTQTDALAPEAPLQDLVQWLAEQPDGVRAAAVGHEPHLGDWCSWMLSGGQQSFIRFKKGGVCLMALSSPAAAGTAELAWLAPPRQLRHMRK